ncbi:GroEL apical domain-like protein, partial [Fomitiporia mediterranea MF3/22]|uniref:GroEL apical domain-like protein n=1 Tax=Fomitiporia mediterranea (strain MF3/22) TaxID=694068 RepID=UPI00044080CB
SKNTKALTTTEEIARIASLSTNSNTHVGNPIVTTIEKVGKEGVITVKEGRTIEDNIEIVEGMRFDQGYISPYFVTDAKSQKIEFDRPLVLLSEKKISSLQDITPSLKAAAQTRRPLLIVAEDVDGEALEACTLNKVRGQLQVAAVKAPGFGDNQKGILGDLAILTSGTVFTDKLDIKLDRTTPDLLGSTGSVTITKEDTIFFNGEGSKDAIQARCEQIRSALNDPTTGEYDKTKLQDRLARLTGGVAVIRVCSLNDLEATEKKNRYDDAINATRADVEVGVLPGGGVALLKASLSLPTSGDSNTASSSSSEPIPTANCDEEDTISINHQPESQSVHTILRNSREGSSATAGTLTLQHGAPEQFSQDYDASKGQYVDTDIDGIREQGVGRSLTRFDQEVTANTSVTCTPTHWSCTCTSPDCCIAYPNSCLPADKYTV